MKHSFRLLFSRATPAAEDRTALGQRAGIIGIVLNLLLAAGKAAVGISCGAISALADAVNNLTDAAASIVTAVGFRLSARPADEEHPYGHARSEHVSALIVSLTIILVAFELGKSSFDKVLHPAAVSLSVPALVGLFAALFVKLFLYFFYKRLAHTLSSDVLRAAAKDSIGDVLASAAVLAALVFGSVTSVPLDGWAGLAVSVFLLISGILSVKETLDPLLGEAPSPELVRHVEEKILSYDTVLGLHDLIVHSYGPGRTFVSVHAEFSAAQDLLVSHDIIDSIERDFAENDHICLVIHLDPVVTDDALANEMKEKLSAFLITVDERLSVHDFRAVYGKTHTNFIFDVAVPISFAVPDARLRTLIRDFFRGADPTYFAVITIDRTVLPEGK